MRMIFEDPGGRRRRLVAAAGAIFVAAVAALVLVVASCGAVSPPRPARDLTANVTRWISPACATVWSLSAGSLAVATLLAAVRIALCSAAAIADARRSRLAKADNDTAGPDLPPLTVVVPAHNEAKVIGSTIGSLLASEFPHIHVLVIDDGSTDCTADVVREFAQADPRVRVLQQPNAGKAAALNLGFATATTEIVVTLDADTLVQPRTLLALAAPFAESAAVDGVCGNVVVGNARRGLLTRMQDVEYLTGQNVDRRALACINGLSVVPGAIAAWRRRGVLAAGGYSAQTLAEDADLTLTVLARGGRIVYAADARGMTEAPETFVGLRRQRFRWAYGMLQCLWKHRRSLGHGTLGCITLPDAILFQVILPVVAPPGCAVLLGCLWRRGFGFATAGCATLAVADLIGSSIAFRLDGRRAAGAPVWALQRMASSGFACAVNLWALAAALAGRRHNWNKPPRTGAMVAVDDPTESACRGKISI